MEGNNDAQSSVKNVELAMKDADEKGIEMKPNQIPLSDIPTPSSARNILSPTQGQVMISSSEEVVKLLVDKLSETHVI